MWQLSVVSALMVTSLQLATSQQSYQNSGCTCVPYYKCQKHNVVGGNIVYPENYVRCDGVVDVCCETAYIGDKEEITMTRSGWQHDGCGKPSFVFNRSQANSNDSGNAEFGEFPWMVTIYESRGINGRHNVVDVPICGGALIRENVVLTAAHCVMGKTVKQLKIRAGEQNIKTSNNVELYQEISVKKFVIHEKFDPKSNLNNYAILFLLTSINFSENVDIVCLPESNQQFNESRCVTSRWGDHPAGHLRRAEIFIFGHDKCENIVGRWLHESFTCAINAAPIYPKPLLQIDGGSPLACQLQDFPFRHILAGFFLLLPNLNNRQQIEIYANVSTARTWINHKITEYKSWPY